MLIVISRATIKKIAKKKTVKQRDFNNILGIISLTQKKKFTTMWKLNNMVQNNQWIKKEILSEIRKYFEINGNENTMYQTL